MSSGYSSLEEDAEDFFFTARTSFFRRAPPGKSRSGQPVSGVRQGRGWGVVGWWGGPGSTCLTPSAGPMLACRRAGGVQRVASALSDPERCGEACAVGVGRPRRGKEVEGQGARWPGPLCSSGTRAAGCGCSSGSLEVSGPLGVAPSTALQGPKPGSRAVLAAAVRPMGHEWPEGTRWPAPG